MGSKAGRVLVDALGASVTALDVSGESHATLGWLASIRMRTSRCLLIGVVADVWPSNHVFGEEEDPLAAKVRHAWTSLASLTVRGGLAWWMRARDRPWHVVRPR